MDQLPIFSSTTLVKNLGLCEFYKESKINRFYFFFSYSISYPQRPDFSLNYFQTVKSAALLSTSCARKTKLYCQCYFSGHLENCIAGLLSTALGHFIISCVLINSISFLIKLKPRVFLMDSSTASLLHTHIFWAIRHAIFGLTDCKDKK